MPILNRLHFQPNIRLLHREGPKIKVRIGLPSIMAQQLKQQGKKLPLIEGEALVDTGASISAVDRQVFQQLAISPIGVVTVRSPTIPQQQNLYPVTFIFPELRLTAESTGVIGSNLLNQGIVALIGRDLLTKFVFIYNGSSGSFTLAF